jgi:3-deoxy-D-manno-octulosonic-acid transferase
MLSFLYNCVLILYALCTLPKWWGKGKYTRRKELPRVSLQNGQKLLWIHAVSLGETRAVIPLYQQFRARFPDLKIVISSTTETGHAEAKKSMPDAACHFFLPFDLSWTMRKLLQQLRPSYLLLVESDIWYHLLKEAKEQGVQTILVNGKISERSYRRFHMIPFFSKRLFSLLDLLCVQNELYLQRFHALGAPLSKLFVTGNIKFDMNSEPRRSLKEELGITDQDRVIVIGSSHEPEEEQLLTALAPLFQQIPHLKILIVPRHPERFSRVASLLQEKKIETLIYSQRDRKRGGEKVVLIDAMGLLSACYQMADIAIVAGSFIPSVGGHNIFEPIVYHAPVLFGPYMHNQSDFVQLILKTHAGKQVTLEELPRTVLEWLQNESLRQQYIAAGKTLVREVQGSVQRTLDCIEPLIK